MPMVYRFDDYEQCMGIYENEALYCVVNTYVKPDYRSELYRYMKDFSKNTKQFFRHDKLQRGLCINSCQQAVIKMGRNSQKYFVRKFPMDSKVSELKLFHKLEKSPFFIQQLIFEFVNYFNAKEQRVMYDDVVNKCINIELMSRFNLSGYSSIEYCIKGDMRPPLGQLFSYN
jgi:hypothetical protein